MARHRIPRTYPLGWSTPHAAEPAVGASSRQTAAAFAWPRGYAVNARTATSVTLGDRGLPRCGLRWSIVTFYRSDVSARYIGGATAVEKPDGRRPTTSGG